jgi:hypothetical protein
MVRDLDDISSLFSPLIFNSLLAYDPKRRNTAEKALHDKFFKESPLPVDPSMFPTWPAKSEQPRKHTSSPKPPSGGKAYSKLLVSRYVNGPAPPNPCLVARPTLSFW